VIYAALLKHYQKKLDMIPFSEHGPAPGIAVSVIIPARNEAENLGNCLRNLGNQKDPPGEVEIIVVDDHSTDNTPSIALQHNVRLVSLANEPPGSSRAFKKQALAAAINKANGKMVLTTDADCRVPPYWVNIMADQLERRKAVMVTGPVRMRPSSSFLSKFQAMDFAILQGITAASVHSGFHDMSSGANLGYLRSAFFEVNGFEGIDDIATGDDMLLMQKFSTRFPGRIVYVFSKEAIVETDPEKTWGQFLRQRIRWASKATRYRDKKIPAILALVYLLNLCLFIMMIAAFFGWKFFVVALAGLMLKTLVEWKFVNQVMKIFSLRYLMNLFPLAQPVHVVYTVISGSFGQFGPVEWKGRKVN